MIRALAFVLLVLCPTIAFGQATCVGDKCAVGGLPAAAQVSSIQLSGPVISANVGVAPLSPVAAVTTAALPFNPFYNNMQQGYQATLIATANGALVIDGYSVAYGDRILVNNQAVGYQNGIYVVLATGSASTPYNLSRSNDFSTPTQI